MNMETNQQSFPWLARVKSTTRIHDVCVRGCVRAHVIRTRVLGGRRSSRRKGHVASIVSSQRPSQTDPHPFLHTDNPSFD